MKVSKKIIIVTLIVFVIIIGLYLLHNNSSSNSTVNPSAYPVITNGSNTVGFCHSTTYNGVDKPQSFRSVYDMTNTTSVLQLADVGGIANGIQYKWAYDPTNIVNILTEITNSSNAYSPSELSALGKTSVGKPGISYLVNKIITIYDKNDPKYKTGQYDLNPYIITTLSNCK